MQRTLSLAGLAVVILFVAGCTKSETVDADAGATSELTSGLAAAEREQAPNNAVSEDASPGVAIGEPGPAWENLEGTDGERHNLRDLEDAKAVVVVFSCNHCPIVVDYEERMMKLVEDYEEKGVVLVAINVNNIEADRMPAMIERAEERGFNFAYIHDPSQQIARDYGATVTPHAFLLDQDRNVVYMGAIDDSRNPENVTEHYLRDAIDAVLAGQQPSVATTQQFGCTIKWNDE